MKYVCFAMAAVCLTAALLGDAIPAPLYWIAVTAYWGIQVCRKK